MQNNSQYSSFTSNIQKVLKNQNNQLSLLTAMLKAFVSDYKYINYSYQDNDGIMHTCALPSYGMILDDLQAVKTSIDNLLLGKGTISVGDKVCTLKVNHIATTPPDILNIQDPTIFSLDSNWFFEQLMFPGAVVTLDLTGQIADKVKQVEICRVIVDSTQADAIQLWNNNLSLSSYDYTTLLGLLNTNGIPYYEDVQTYNLPWIHNAYEGSFQVISDPTTINGITWYTLSTLNYNTISEQGITQGANNVLKVGDRLAYNNSIFRIEQLDPVSKAISIKCVTGAATPANNTNFSYYMDPTFNKQVKVRFGANEYNFIYIKAISPDFGIKSNKWSTCVKFDTNKLIYDKEKSIQFKEFYDYNIVDWGKDMIEEAKNKYITLGSSVPVNAPTLVEENFDVVEINNHKLALFDTALIQEKQLQLNSAKDEIVKAQSELSNKKATINISTDLITNSKLNVEITQYKSEIDNLNTNLAIKRTNYTALVEELRATYNNTIKYTPKYHIRGYFAWPEPVYINDEQTKEQCVVLFEIAYRYKTVNNQLANTVQYEFRNIDGVKILRTYDDWTYIKTPARERILDEETGKYQWASITDETSKDIPFIDIPISAGETVEFKVRSISEAGYPESPRKSEWSNTISKPYVVKYIDGTIIDNFLSTLEKENVTLQFQNEFKNSGIEKHLNDSLLSFTHRAEYIGFQDTSKSEGYISLLDKIVELEKTISTLSLQIADMSSSNNRTFTTMDASNTQIYYEIDDTTRIPIDSSSLVFDFKDGTLVRGTSVLGTTLTTSKSQADTDKLIAAVIANKRLSAVTNPGYNKA